MQTTTTIKIGKRVFRVPQLMISPKEIIDETFNIYRVSISDIGAIEPKAIQQYHDLFDHLRSEDDLIDITFSNGKQLVKMCDALVTHHVYPYGTVYEFESEYVKEITTK